MMMKRIRFGMMLLTSTLLMSAALVGCVNARKRMGAVGDPRSRQAEFEQVELKSE
jgi:hypothetical protein